VREVHGLVRSFLNQSNSELPSSAENWPGLSVF